MIRPHARWKSTPALKLIGTMGRIVSVMMILCFGSVGACQDQGGLQVGAAMRNITPDPLLPVSGGMGPSSPSHEKRGELTARAIVFRKADITVAVVSVDLLGFPSVLLRRVSEQVPEVPEECLLIGATHTHSAPDVYAFPDGQGGHTGDLKYIDFVCSQAADALKEALQNLKPARLRVATGEAKGKIAYNYYAPDLYDRRVGIIQAVSADESAQVIGTLVNYAIHPEVLGSGEGIVSPDLVGPLCDTIEERFGGTALFMNGAQGGMVTADNRLLDQPSDAQRGYWQDARTWEECERIGRQLGTESIRIVEAESFLTDPQLVCRWQNATFPVDSDELWAVVQHSPLGYPTNADRSITTRINHVRLGTAEILTIPGEALPNLGFFLKRKMKSEHRFLFGLTNDAFGYIMTEVDFQSFPRYDYISRVSLGEKTGPILIESSLELLNE